MLTPKQHQIYQMLFKYIVQNGYAPSISEIAQAVDSRSKGYIHRQLQALEKAGKIRRTDDSQRNIELIEEEEGGGSGSLPIIGRIAAGCPIEAVEDDRNVDISGLLGGNRFVLEVKGDSMLGDNICDGDYIICERCATVDTNDIAVVLVDRSDATLKRVKDNRNGTVSLIPSNPHFSPLVYRKEEILIQGVYLGLLRLEH